MTGIRSGQWHDHETGCTVVFTSDQVGEGIFLVTTKSGWKCAVVGITSRFRFHTPEVQRAVVNFLNANTYYREHLLLP